MNSIFSKIKNKLGIKTDSATDNHSSPHYAASYNDDIEYDVVFNDQSLGISVTDVRNVPIIDTVTAGSNAYNYGVERGDRIVQIESYIIHTFVDFSKVIANVTAIRPLKIRYYINSDINFCTSYREHFSSLPRNSLLPLLPLL